MTLLEKFNESFVIMARTVTKSSKRKFNTEETVLIITRPISTLIKIIKKNEELPEKSDIYNSVLVAKLYLRTIERPEKRHHLTKKQQAIMSLEKKIAELEKITKTLEKKDYIELPSGIKLR